MNEALLAVDRDLAFGDGPLRLPGRLRVPPGAGAVILFAHGSGSSRLSPRNRRVADALEATGMATYLFDLLDEHEVADRRLVFDIDLLAQRLLAAAARASAERELDRLPVAYFGASTGAAAALVAQARGGAARAIVSRGGRPDLAGDEIADVSVPTLLIVGERDPLVLELNRAAFERLGGPRALEIVPGATHLFEEPGAMEVVTELAVDWFRRHLLAA